MTTLPSAETQEAVEPVPAAKPEPAKGKGSMALFNFWIDVALFVAVVFVMWVSAMMQAAFSPPTAAAGWRLWGLSFDDWRNLQFYALCVCALIALEHVVLHWTWVCSIIAAKVLRTKKKPDEGVQAAYGIGTFIAVMVVMLGSIVAAVLMVQKPMR